MFMAQKTVVFLEDDLDGGAADETVTFALDGVSYEMDLSAGNAAKVRAVFGPYVAASRRIGGRPARARSGGSAKVDREQLTAIRVWAAQEGIEIKNRGRIPSRVVEQYHAAAALPAAAPTLVAEPSKGRKTSKAAADKLFSG